MPGRFSHLNPDNIEAQKIKFWELHGDKVKKVLDEVNRDVFNGKYEIINENEVYRIRYHSFLEKPCYVLLNPNRDLYICIRGLPDGFEMIVSGYDGLINTRKCNLFNLEDSIEFAIKHYFS